MLAGLEKNNRCLKLKFILNGGKILLLLNSPLNKHSELYVPHWDTVLTFTKNAVVEAIQKNPIVNSMLDGNVIVYKKDVHYVHLGG